MLVALDGLSDRQAMRMARRLEGSAGGFKVGLELFALYGPSFIRRLSEGGSELFLDMKYHDIPETVERAVDAACRMGPDYLTIHASGGEEMLRSAVRGRGGRPTRLLGVTVLTSLSGRGVGRRVRDLALLAREAGLDGVIASARETPEVKRLCGKDFLVMVPGIRPAGAPSNDQKRVATPAEAARAGADRIVVGRPITRSGDPLAALEAVEKEFRDARR